MLTVHLYNGHGTLEDNEISIMESSVKTIQRYQEGNGPEGSQIRLAEDYVLNLADSYKSICERLRNWQCETRSIFGPQFNKLLKVLLGLRKR
jgi:hypothetical protein